MSSRLKKSESLRAGILSDIPDMDVQEFNRWANLLSDQTGLNLPIERKSFLLTSLLARMREVGCKTYVEYETYLRDSRQSVAEWAALIDRLTVHETRFFRDREAMDLVAKHAEQVCKEQQAFYVWSVGCATGEEAYSMAMLLDQKLEAAGGTCFFGVTATDISMPCLATAREGSYSARRMRSVPELWRRHYFRELAGGEFKVVDWLKRRIAFLHLNIVDAEATPLGEMDAIYCQNVLFYFDQLQRHRLLNGMVRHLKIGGILVLGPGEVSGWSHPELSRVAGTNVLAFERRRVDEQQH